MIFTTNKHPQRWGGVLHDDDLADAIVDRILERGRLLRLDGHSVRTKHLPEDELRIDDQDEAGGREVSGIEPAEFPERTRNVAALPRHAQPTHLIVVTTRSARAETLTTRRGDDDEVAGWWRTSWYDELALSKL